jgi:hypothetical protein
MQFLVLAYDGRDDRAKVRRAAARPAHFAGIKPMVERGELRAAGAILDDAGDMIGSVIFAEFPSRSDLDAWLAKEPYVEGAVCQRAGLATDRDQDVSVSDSRR